MKPDRTGGNLHLLLLSVVQSGPAHGYEVIRRLREISDGEFDLPEGTIYPALHHLEAQRWLASGWDTSGPRRRRIYELTDTGRAQLEHATREWRRFAGAIDTVLEAGT